MEMKLHINTSYMSVKKSSKSENTPHTDMIQESFKIEAKVMETSDSMEWECKLFTHEFIGFRDTYYGNEIKSNTSYISITTSYKS